MLVQLEQAYIVKYTNANTNTHTNTKIHTNTNTETSTSSARRLDDYSSLDRLRVAAQIQIERHIKIQIHKQVQIQDWIIIILASTSSGLRRGLLGFLIMPPGRRLSGTGPLQASSYTDENTQIHKYTNTKIHKYKIHK